VLEKAVLRVPLGAQCGHAVQQTLRKRFLTEALHIDRILGAAFQNRFETVDRGREQPLPGLVPHRGRFRQKTAAGRFGIRHFPGPAGERVDVHGPFRHRKQWDRQLPGQDGKAGRQLPKQRHGTPLRQ